jgi:hypothetical protein
MEWPLVPLPLILDAIVKALVVVARGEHAPSITTASPPPDPAPLEIIGPLAPPEAVSYGLIWLSIGFVKLIRAAIAVVIISVAVIGAISISVAVIRAIAIGVGRTKAEW